jgi:hypothetical protein
MRQPGVEPGARQRGADAIPNERNHCQRQRLDEQVDVQTRQRLQRGVRAAAAEAWLTDDLLKPGGRGGGGGDPHRLV